MTIFARAMAVSIVTMIFAPTLWAASENARRDANRNPVMMGVTGDAAQERRMLRMDPNTGQMLISLSRTWTGALPEVFIIGIDFSVTVHGNLALSSLPAITGNVEVTGTVSLSTGYSHIGKADVWRHPAGERTNLLPYSDQLDHANWGSNGVTITVNADNGPRGAPTAELVTQNSATSEHVMYSYDLVLSNNKRFCMSVDAKNNGQDWIAITLADDLDYWMAQYFDIANNVRGNTVNITSSSKYVVSESPKIFSVGNGYLRCQACFQFGASSGDSAWQVGIGLVRKTDNDNFTGIYDASYAGDSTSGVYLTNVQVEGDVEFPGPHIRTEGSPVKSGTNYQMAVRLAEGQEKIGTVGLEAGTNNIGDMDVLSANFAAGNGSTPSAGVMNGFTDGALTSSTMRFGSLILRSDLQEPITLGDSTTLGIQGIGALSLLNINGLVKDLAHYARQSGSPFTISGGESGYASHVKVVNAVKSEVQGDITGAGKLVTWTMTSAGNGWKAGAVVPTSVRVGTSQYEVSVGTSAVNLFPASLVGTTSAIVVNESMNTVYLGDANVTTANGLPIGSQGGSMSFEPSNGEFQIWGISSKAAQDVRVMRW